MPFVPETDGEFPTLGWGLLEWFSEYLRSPRDPSVPVQFTTEQAQLLLDWYAVDPVSGEFVYRRGISRRSKGWGKSPLEAAKSIAELAGPVRFDGWDSNGRPVGRPWGTSGDPNAWVQIAAVSEDQTENTHSVVYEFLTANDGAAADALKIDAGLTRSYLRDGDRRGKLEPVTTSAGTREGQPVTYAVLDETHLWVPRNGGVRMAKTLRRNVAKMGGRSYETTNSFVPGQRTVAESSHKAALLGHAGIFYDAVEAPTVKPDCTDDELSAAIAIAYGDSWWIDVDRLVAEARDPDMPWDDVCRFSLNWNRSLSSGYIDIKAWEDLSLDVVPPAGERVALGFDGSISGDCTALYGCTAAGFVFEVAAWEHPPDVDKWRVPRGEVHDAVANAFDRWDVGRMFCDPPKWETEVESWAGRYGSGVVLAFDTNQPRRMAPCSRRFLTACEEKSIAHDGRPGLTDHLAACAKKQVHLNQDADDGRTPFVIVKADTRKIDRAVAAVLSYEAAMTMPEPVDVPSGDVVVSFA